MRRPFATAVVLVASVVTLATPACSRDKGSTKAFCAQVRKVPTMDTVVQGFADADPEELQERLDGANAAYDQLHDSAPSAIRDDVGSVTSLVGLITTAVGEHHEDPEAVTAEIRDAMKEHADATKAAQRVAVYAKKECGVDLNPVEG